MVLVQSKKKYRYKPIPRSGQLQKDGFDLSLVSLNQRIEINRKAQNKTLNRNVLISKMLIVDMFADAVEF